MANKKNAEKRPYTKKSARWGKTPRKIEAEAGGVSATPKTNKELLYFVLNGVDRLSTGDKARVFAHIIGKQELDDHRVWAIEKLLKD